MKAPLVFTHNAASKVWELIKEEGNLNLKLRVYVTGGGCSGFQYGFKFDEQVNNDDTVVTCRIQDNQEDQEEEDDEGEGGSARSPIVSLLVDPLSFQYLIGAEIDYTEGLEGAQFVIRNPNAKTTCGCGSSFSA